MSKIIFTNGVFDLLHPGHFNLLSYCRKLAGRKGLVFVGLDADSKVRKDKGKNRPYFKYRQRSDALRSLMDVNGDMLVDACFKFTSNKGLHRLIGQLHPDTIVKGSDWKGNVVGSDLCKVVYFSKLGKISSTAISSAVIKKYRNRKK